MDNRYVDSLVNMIVYSMVYSKVYRSDIEVGMIVKLVL